MIKRLENITAKTSRLTRKFVIEARTATTGGGDTGTITAGTTHVIPTCDADTKAFILPAMEVGDVITFDGAAGTDYLLKVPTGYTVNGAAATTSSKMTKTCKVTATCYDTKDIQVVMEVIATGVKTLPTFA